MFNLKGKVAAVFAANGAIASEVAKSLAKQGATVYLSGRNDAALKALALEIENSGGAAYTALVDALNEDQINGQFQHIVKREGKIDIVFNGIGLRADEGGYAIPSTLLPLATFMRPLEQIVGSQFLTARAGAQFMAETNTEGTILMLTASLSRIKAPCMAGITAACAAIEGLTRVLAAEFGQLGIRVLCMNPTALPETRTIQETAAAQAAGMNAPIEAVIENMGQGSLLGKMPTTKDVGALAAFLVSDTGALLNSHVVDVDYGTASVI